MSDSRDEPDGWLTMAQAADRLGVSPPTLRRWADQGRIGVRRTLGGHRRIPISELPSITPMEVPLPLRPQPEPQPPPRPDGEPRHELPHGRAEVLDADLAALRAERDRLAADLATARAEQERLARELAFLRRQVEESTRAQAELRQVILRLVGSGDGDGRHPAGPGNDEAARPER